VSRLAQEAAAVGADAVIGAHLRERMITMGSRGKGGDDGGEVIEFTVFGTAVRAPWITHVPGSPVVTDLSGQDLWALAQDGFEPCGFLFEFCRYHVWHVMKNGISSSGEVTAAQAIELAKRGEDAARAADPRITNSDGATFSRTVISFSRVISSLTWAKPRSTAARNSSRLE